MKLTIAEIRATLTDKKREEDKDTLWAHCFMRPMSVYPAWLFLRLNMSANQVTMLGFMVGLAACILLGYGSYLTIIIAAILVNIRSVLDYSDGTVARATKNCTPYGQFLDRILDDVIGTFIPVAIGIGLCLHPDNKLATLLGIEIPNITFVIMGLTYSILSTLSSLISDEMALVFSIIPSQFYRPQEGKEWSLWGILYRMGINIQPLSTILLLICALANALSLFLAFYILVTLAEISVALGKRILTMPTKTEKEKKDG